MATSLDYFLPHVNNTDSKRRMTTYDELIKYLSDPDNSVQCDDIDGFIDGLNGWIDCSNYKISQNGLEVMSFLIDRMGSDFKNYINIVLPHIIERLGDNKDSVRLAGRTVLLKMMGAAQSPQNVMERLVPSFGHKLWRVREELLLCVQQALSDFGAKSFTLSKTLPSICKLLEDANAPVRDAATLTLVEIYRHIGERMRNDIMKREIHPSKLSVLLGKMDELRDNGGIIADDAVDETDFAKPAAPKAQQQPAKRVTKSAGPSRSLSSSSSGKETGALDKETFMKAFEDVPQVMIFSGRDVTDKMSRIRDTLSDANIDWEKRVDALKEVRSLLLAGAKEYDEFSQQLKTYSSCFSVSVKDLRSQVVREACITIAYLSQELLNKFDSMAEIVLPNLISQIPNSAKIMSSSGSTCIRFILQHTHAPRLIPIIASQLTSKAAVIRRECCDFIDLVLRLWPTYNLEKHIALLQDAIKKGISDADPDARQFSRRAFWAFAEHFRDQAESLRNSLDPAKQKQLEGTISNASSNNSLQNAGISRNAPATSKNKVISSASSRTRSMSTERGNGSVTTGRQFSLPSSTKAATVSRPNDTLDGTTATDDSDASGGIMRSSSAIDLVRGAANTTRAVPAPSANNVPASRANYYSLRQTRSTVDLSGSSDHKTRIPQLRRAQTICRTATTRPRKSTGPSSVVNTKTLPTPEHRRNKARPGVSQSQPSSRSGSPSSRIPQLGITSTSSTSGQQRRKTTGIPHSQGASRETSPSRSGIGHERRPSMPNPRLGSDMNDTLQQAAMRLQQPNRRNGDPYESDDNASETSSICSERSFSSRSRTADDMAEVLKLLTSGSWGDRKEGLLSLQGFIHNNRQLNRSELKKITEIFTRMFHDPHGKVLSVFFETLIDLMSVYKFELLDWLQTMLTRLLSKMGADMLGSVLVKVQRALDAVRETFPVLEQFNIITRFIIDQSQTPNLKVKIAILNYVSALTVYMSPQDFVNNSDTRLSVSRIITWTTEPKSTEVRKAAQAVLIALFNLNTPEFSMLLTGLPKTFQEGATKILQSHLRGAGSDGSGPLTPRSPTGLSNMSRPLPYRNRIDDIGTENMNPEDIYNSIKQTSADIQNLSLWDGSGRYEHTKKDVIQVPAVMIGNRRRSSGDSGGPSELKDTSLMHRFLYDPSQYQEKGGFGRITPANLITRQDFIGDDMNSSSSDTVADIITELSQHNSRHEERKNAMLHLIKLCRTEQPEEMWMEHFKNVLLLLLETLGDDDAHIRALALRVLREMLRSQADKFRGYLELTTLKVLEAHRDTEKEVTRSAEECAATLASVVNTDQCLHVLGPIIATAQYPVCLAAIKMATKVIEQAPKDIVLGQLKNLVPGVLKGYDNPESSVRKASVFCLVAMHFSVGDELYAYLKDLNGSKLKLLNLYIKRAAGDRDQTSATTSKTASPTPALSDFQ